MVFSIVLSMRCDCDSRQLLCGDGLFSVKLECPHLRAMVFVVAIMYIDWHSDSETNQSDCVNKQKIVATPTIISVRVTQTVDGVIWVERIPLW